MANDAETPDNRWLTVKDVAAIADVPVVAVRRAIYYGELPAYRLGGRRNLRLRQQDVERYCNTIVVGPIRPQTAYREPPPPMAARYREGGWIYFLATADEGFVKIGWSRNILARQIQLEAAHPRPLKILGVIKEDGRNTEHAWHKRFVANRVRGEWFTLTNELRAAIIEAVVREHTRAR